MQSLTYKVAVTGQDGCVWLIQELSIVSNDRQAYIYCVFLGSKLAEFFFVLVGGMSILPYSKLFRYLCYAEESMTFLHTMMTFTYIYECAASSKGSYPISTLGDDPYPYPCICCALVSVIQYLSSTTTTAIPETF